MKSLLSVIAVFLFLAPVFSQKTENDKKEKLSGKVKSVATQDFIYVDESLNNKAKPKERGTIFFDEKGNEIEKIVYDDYGFPFGKEILTYDTNGLLLENTLTNKKNSIVDKTRFEYKNGKLFQIISLDDSNNERVKSVNLYDEKGRKIEEAHFIKTRFSGKTVFKYDENSNLIEAVYFDADGNKLNAPIGVCLSYHKLLYSYPNSDNKEVKIVSYDSKDNVKNTWTYVYDSKNRLVEYTKSGGGSKIFSKYAYLEDEKGNWIKRTATIENSSTFKIFQIDMPTIKSFIVTERKITYF